MFSWEREGVANEFADWGILTFEFEPDSLRSRSGVTVR